MRLELPEGRSGRVAAAKLQSRQREAGGLEQHEQTQLVARLAAGEGAPEEGKCVVVEQGHLRPQQHSLQRGWIRSCL